MASPTSTDDSMSRRTWTDAALVALAKGGIEAVKVETLAKSLAVTKGSFYWHFGNRQDLHRAVLDRWEELATTQIIEQVESPTSADPTVRLRALVEVVFHADTIGAGVETAIRGWAAADELAGEAVRRVDTRRTDYVAGLLRPLGHSPASARRRARLLYRAMIGEFVWRTTGGPTSSKSDLDDLVDLLAATKQR